MVPGAVHYGFVASQVFVRDDMLRYAFHTGVAGVSMLHGGECSVVFLFGGVVY